MTSLIFLFGYLVFVLVAIWGVEEFLSAVTTPLGPFGAPSQEGDKDEWDHDEL